MEKLEEDRLSSLPKAILHCILSRLPEKDAAKTSVLSKAWLDTWYTFPILSFCISNFMEKKRKRNIMGFRNYVERTIQRFRDQSLAIKEFKLKMDCFGLENISNDIDILLKLACECGVEVIEYSQDVPVGQGQAKYRVLPMFVIETKSITKLGLKGPYIKIDPTFSINKFSSLRELSLWWVLFGDEHAINHLISFCPLIECIKLKFCYVLSTDNITIKRIKSLSINSLQKLKRVDTYNIQDVSIDSPSLETLSYHCPNDLNAPLNINFDWCRNLKALWIWYMKGTFFTDKWFLELFPKLPFLESLMLNSCKLPERIDILSVRLKVLELSNCYNLKKLNIDAPNLLSCRYIGNYASEPTISFSRNSSQLEVNIRIHVTYWDFFNLREFVHNIKPNNVLTSLDLSISNPSNFDAMNLVASNVSFTPPSIKHLTISYVPNNKCLFSYVVNILLASCCPKTISLSVFYCNKEFVELFYETLMRRKEDECFCASDNTRCWWHGLKDVKVTSSMKMDEDVVDFKTILESLALVPFETISFRLDF